MASGAYLLHIAHGFERGQDIPTLLAVYKSVSYWSTQ
jgi:hypothetical protein